MSTIDLKGKENDLKIVLCNCSDGLPMMCSHELFYEITFFMPKFSNVLCSTFISVGHAFLPSKGNLVGSGGRPDEAFSQGQAREGY